MRFLSTLLFASLTPFSDAAFPLQQMLRKIIASASSNECTPPFERAKALLMTLPIEKNFHSLLETAIPKQRPSIAQALILLQSNMSRWTQSISVSQSTILISSVAPIELLEKMMSILLGKSLSFEQQTILSTILHEVQALARVLVATLSLPDQYHTAIWMAYAASKVLPQRSILSVFACAVLLPQRGPTRLRTVMTGLAISLPLFFHAVRTVGDVNKASSTNNALELAECLLAPQQRPKIRTSLVRAESSFALPASLASVPLLRLLGGESRRTKPTMQFWRTTPQFWQGIYHAVKQDEYYCLLEDDESSSKAPVPLA